ncbi:MAG: efflux RND transporter periplasmic adaptor subunit [Acidobacteriota bacterium]
MSQVRRRRGGWGVVCLAVFLIAAMAQMVSCAGNPEKRATYYCPMHPQVTSHRKGDCQICGMHLVVAAQQATGESGSSKNEKAEVHVCPMHPQVQSRGPSDCSICGMHLVPVPKVEQREAGAVTGLAPVSLGSESMRRMGYVSSSAQRSRLDRTVRLPARIVADPTRVRPIISRVDGFVTSLHVWSAGQRVSRGQPLMGIYSLGILSIQQQYLNSSPAYGGKRFYPPSTRTQPEAVEGATEGVDRSKLRLKDWDFSDEQIARIERTGSAEDTLEMASPVSGYITSYTVVLGQKVAPGDPLLTITDLSRVWAEVDVFEREVPLLKEGLPVVLELPSLPGRTFRGKVRTFQRALDPQVRTSRVIVELPNQDALLVPGMIASAEISFDGGDRLCIPSSAVIRDGERAYVFVETSPGQVRPTLIELGLEGGGKSEVLGGLSEGDRVVSSSTFLIDSESSLRAALQAAGEGQ